MDKNYLRPGLYRHHKTGTVYEVIGTGKHSETLEPMVAYRSPKGEIWFRPHEMFISKVKNKDGREVARFEYIERDW